MSFNSIYRHGFARVAACSSRVSLADPETNAAAILRVMRACDKRGVAVLVLPELSLSGYSIDDLLLQDTLLDGVEQAIAHIVGASAKLLPLTLFGAPLRHGGRIYNCAVAVHRGRLLGIVPKIFLPNYREYYEHRHFGSGEGIRGETISVAGHSAPFGPDQIFVAENFPDLVVHAEICEDMWVPIPPSGKAAIRWAISSKQFDERAGEILNSILAMEITPELVPVVAGETPQSTEAKVGPYELQDFNLFYTLRYGFRPSKIAFLAGHAWGDAAKGDWPPDFPENRRRAYDRATIKAWLRVFLQRFFGFSQFNRSAMPNGPKVSAGGSLSPRGDWRARQCADLAEGARRERAGRAVLTPQIFNGEDGARREAFAVVATAPATHKAVPVPKLNPP